MDEESGGTLKVIRFWAKMRLDLMSDKGERGPVQ